MRPGASEPPLAPYAGVTGVQRPGRGGAGLAPPAGAGRVAPRTYHTPEPSLHAPQAEGCTSSIRDMSQI
jgi:hypothetical protein